MLTTESVVLGDLENLALEVYLCTEKIHEAAAMVERCTARQGERPGLLLRKASVLGLMARYQEACEILLELNRALPHRPAILRRLVTVYEQLREEEKAEAFRRARRKTELTAV